MFGRFVEIAGEKIFVTCSPHTPLSDVLFAAAEQMKREERRKRESDPNHIAFRKAL